MNLDNVLKGSKISFCETVFVFDLGHDDDSVWQVRRFGCLRLIFAASSILCRRQKSSFSMVMFGAARGIWRKPILSRSNSHFG